MKDNLLHCVSKDKVTNTISHRRVVYSEDEKKQILNACHDGIDGGHLGRDKTYGKVWII